MKKILKNFIGGMILVIVTTLSIENDWSFMAAFLGGLGGWIILFIE